MTIDERIEALTARHEALTMNVELISRDVESLRQTAAADGKRIEALLKVGHREKVLRPDPQRQFGVVLLGAVRATFLREKYGVPALGTPAAIEAIASFFLQGAGR